MTGRSVAQWIFNFAVLAIVALALAGVGWLFARAIEQGATFLGAVLAAFATVGAVVLGRYHERKKDAQSVRRRELGNLYEQTAAVMAGQTLSSRGTEKFVAQFMRKGLVYAGPGVLEAFREWRDNLAGDEASREESRADMIRFEKLVKAMRKDLGISNWMLQDGDLLRVALTDFDDEFPQDSGVLAPPEPPEEPRVVATRSRGRQPSTESRQ